MGRSIVAPGHGNKRRVSISPDPEILEWVLSQTGPGKRFASVTHAAEYAWQQLRENDEGPAEKKGRK